jgi:long-chain fatty acid transport protein
MQVYRARQLVTLQAPPVHAITAHRSLAILVAAVSMAFAPACWAAGPWLAETGGADMGLAGAGRAAMSLDAAALASNPAAIGGLSGSSITAAAMPSRLDFEFHGTGQTTAHASNEEGTNTVPALYAVYRDDWLTYGIGVYSYLGLSFDAGNQWEGRRVIEKAGLATLNIAPTVAWSATDRLTVGASIAAQLARPEARMAVANDAMFYGPPAGLPDGQVKLSGDSWAVGGQLGLTYEPMDDVRVGVAWTAPVDHSVALDIDAKGLHPVLATVLASVQPATLAFTLPQQVLLGVTQQAGNSTTLSLGVSWQDWSKFGDSHLKLPGQSTPMFAGGLQDTWGASIGARRAFGDGWAGSAGVGYESSPATSGGVPVYFPVAEQWTFAAGIEHPLADSVRLRAEVSVIFQDEAKVVQASNALPLPGVPPLTGTYENARVYLFALTADFSL